MTSSAATTSNAEFDTIRVYGEVRVTVDIADDMNRPTGIARSELLATSISDGALVIKTASERAAPATAAPGGAKPAADDAPTMTVTAGPLTHVLAASGAHVTLSGVLDHLDVSALNYGTVDATALALRTANVDLELSTVSLDVAEEVTGFVVYLSELTVSGGASVENVTTANGGRLVTEPDR